MESKVNFAAVGAFVIVLTMAMIAGTLWLSSGKYYRKAYDTYETYMTESVSGLNLNAPVRYHGVDVGRVRAIMLSPGNVEEVRLTLDVERGTPVKADTVATLRSQGLTGIAFVELSAGRRDSPALHARPGEAYPVIASAPSLIEHLETATPVLLANLARMTDNLNAVLDEPNRRAVGVTLTNLAALTQTLAARSSSIDATLVNAARTMDHAAHVSAELPRLVQRFDRTADALEHMAGEVVDASHSVRGTFDSAQQTLDGTREDLTQFTGATLPEVREMVTELRGLTATMRRVGEEVERNPGALLQRPRPAKRGPGE
jgi:phospholipid/cholesterol/gamma-HCH transport system substrate-binding protein